MPVTVLPSSAYSTLTRAILNMILSVCQDVHANMSDLSVITLWSGGVQANFRKFGLRIWQSALRDVASDTVKWSASCIYFHPNASPALASNVTFSVLFFRHTWTCLFLAGTAPQGSDELNSLHSIRSSPSLLRNTRFIQVSRLRLPVLSCKFLSTVLLLTPGRLLKFDCWLLILQYFVFLCGPGDGAV